MSLMDQEHIDKEALIVQLLENDFNDEAERDIAFKKLLQDEEAQKEYFRLKSLWNGLNQDNIPSAKLQWKRVEQNIAAIDTKTNNQKKISLIKVAGIAAVLLIGIVIGQLFTVKDNDYISMNRVEVPNGARSTVYLADGTEVKLNSGSELIYPSEFKSDERNVTLKGEAYFKVKANKKSPFLVHTQDYDVKVTGTEFNVSAYPEFDRTVTTLVEGEVMILSPKSRKPFKVEPGNKLEYYHTSGLFYYEKASIGDEISWVNDSFGFKNIPFKEFVLRLERWYDVDIIYDEEMFKKDKYTGKFENKETIWQVLDVMAFESIGYERIKNRKIKLYKKKLPM